MEGEEVESVCIYNTFENLCKGKQRSDSIAGKIIGPRESLRKDIVEWERLEIKLKEKDSPL